MKRYTLTDLIQMTDRDIDDAVARVIMNWRMSSGENACGRYWVWKDHHGEEKETTFYPTFNGGDCFRVIQRLVKHGKIIGIWDNRVFVGNETWFYNDGNTAKAICCAALLTCQK
jgi:hypothetical protein